MSLRSEPSHRSELVTQLLQDECFEIIQRQDDWCNVRCCYDGYEGWAQTRQIDFCTIHQQDSRPPASSERHSSPSVVAKQHYLMAPYLWGGRTPFGIDCSGLTQVCFKRCGLYLPRDASQQALTGDEVAHFDDARCDDLMFFGDTADRITHVGIYMGQRRIIHSCGYVDINDIDSTGILDPYGNGYSHYLQKIRRIR